MPSAWRSCRLTFLSALSVALFLPWGDFSATDSARRAVTEVYLEAASASSFSFHAEQSKQESSALSLSAGRPLIEAAGTAGIRASLSRDDSIDITTLAWPSPAGRAPWPGCLPCVEELWTLKSAAEAGLLLREGVPPYCYFLSKSSQQAVTLFLTTWLILSDN